MSQKKNFLPTFFTFLIIALLVFILSCFGLLNSISGFFEKGTTPLQKFTYGIFYGNDDNSEIGKLRQDNQKLVSQIVKGDEMKKENDALRAQFETTNPPSTSLLPASIIGGTDGAIMIDKGSADGVKKGMVVVFKDNLIGLTSTLSEHIAKVDLLGSNDFSTTAKTLKTNALGIVKGQDGSIILGSVVLSDKLSKDDLVVSKGDVTDSGSGIPPDLVIGKIVSINKKASSLFQSAEVESLVDVERLEMVFVIGGNLK